MSFAVSSLLRSLQAAFVLAREGALALIDPAFLPPLARVGIQIARTIERRGAGDGAQRLAAALSRLGPSYVKFGQFLATRPDVVGIRIARDLEVLQDRLPPFPQETAESIVAEALGKPVALLFERFGPAVAAASIAQVHKATLKTGAEVAVKVLRPGIRTRFTQDIEALRWIARQAERFSAQARRLQMRQVAETLARSVLIEMDLRLEAASLSQLSENTQDDADFHNPRPYWEWTARDVLVSEWIDAVPLHDLARLDAAKLNRPALAKALVRSFLKQAIRDGFFHADMHPGNLFADARGRIVAVDCGIMGRLGLKERRFLAEILHGFIIRDYRRVADVHFEAGYVPSHHDRADFAVALRAVGEPIHDRPAEDISMAKLLGLLFEITSLFEMKTRPELVMLQKTMVVVEGVGRMLDPRFDMWRTAEPVVRSWIERHLGPVGRLEEAGRELAGLARLAGRLPEIAAQAERVLNRVEDEKRPSKRNLSVFALWAIAAALLWIGLK